ncbi:MAG: MOSC domain-containing protein YiiM [Candidatus Krumholzibacteriia bacterium]|jgi:MOSC domain-containing protein YiiM
MALGSTVIQVTEQPHTGCQKFINRYGAASTKFVNSKLGRELDLRGINANVIQAGVIKVGDTAKVLRRPQNG